MFRNVDTKFRCRGITQKKEYNIQNMAKVWNYKHRNGLLYADKWNLLVLNSFMYIYCKGD
jgi:hypothetical protein